MIHPSSSPSTLAAVHLDSCQLFLPGRQSDSTAPSSMLHRHSTSLQSAPAGAAHCCWPPVPAGTGKTHTVKGVLNVWSLVAYQRYYKSLMEALTSDR